MKKPIVATALAAVIALAVAVAALGGSQASSGKADDDSVTLAVYGDSPYGTSNADTAQFAATPAFIDTINADPKVSLVLHVGDIHSGKQSCPQTYDQAIYEKWKAFKDPLVYTPGDNEWSDCHKSGEGGGTYNAGTSSIDFVYDAPGVLTDFAGGNPLANLLLIRSIFFPKPGVTLGQHAMRVQSQALDYDRSHPSDQNYVENVMWEQADVLFVTINLPGGSNNDGDIWYGAPTASPDQTQEAAQRTDADLRWLDAAFTRAKRERVKAVVIGAQADMWDPEKGAAHQTLYEPFVKKIADATNAFGKPVIMFNGDSHIYRSDNPLSPTAGCVWAGAGPCVSDYAIHPNGNYDAPNFHRIVVHGSTAPMEWLKVTVNPKANAPNGDNAFGPLKWERQIQNLP